MAYLDNTGLAYFWSKVKAYVDTHTGGGLSLDDVYPVGSIYMSVSQTSPATLFGGTWVQIEDTFLLAAGNTYSAGSTGGEAEHTLSIDEMPRHAHGAAYKRYNITMNSSGNSFGLVSLGTGNASVSAEDSGSYIQPRGETYAHNNMPPYIAVYVWKRTA